MISFKNLPVEAFPDVTDIQVNVITLYPGRAAEEVEKQVTIPVEIALAGIPNSIRVFSHTQFGLSFLMVTFNDKTTDLIARQQVLERLRKVDLPDPLGPMIATTSPSLNERSTLSSKAPRVRAKRVSSVIEQGLDQHDPTNDL